MEFIEGMDLSLYLRSATALEQGRVVDCIITALDHLATIPLPNKQGPGPIGSGPLQGYLWSDSGIHSSFASISEMDSWMNGILAKYRPSLDDGNFDFTSEKLVLCHTDLAPRNILWLHGQVALLDWGSAGFYPRIFETYVLRTRIDREPIFAKILLRLPEEVKDEKQIQLLGKIELILLRHSNVINL
jgi:hypothetical protein